MANDPSMPPSEQAPRVPVNASPAMSPGAGPAMPPPPGAGGPPAGPEGNVMINIPKGAFDAMHRIVLQLAVGLNELKKNVDAQQSGGGMPPGAGPVPPGAGPEPSASPAPEGEGDASDEEFLKGLAEEGTKR